LTDGVLSRPASHRKELTVEDKVISIVSEQLSVSKEEVTRESSFIDDLHADSLDLVELGMKFEEEFGVSIPDEDYEKLRTVGDAIDYIQQRESA
jgi:acyl carrier protein